MVDGLYTNMFSSAHDAKTNTSRVANRLEICRTKSDTKPTFRRRGDFSPISTLAAGEFMSEMHEATPVSQPFPHFERLVDSREAAALLQIHPKTLQRLARKGEIRAMRIGKLWRFRTSDLDAWVHLRLKLASYPYRP
jgi:excisionase family DNA binding protein